MAAADGFRRFDLKEVTIDCEARHRANEQAD